MLKTLNKTSDHLAKHDANSMVGQQKLSTPHISPEKQEEYFSSFEAMIAGWLLPGAKDKRDMDILMFRIGWSREGSKILEEHKSGFKINFCCRVN